MAYFYDGDSNVLLNCLFYLIQAYSCPGTQKAHGFIRYGVVNVLSSKSMVKIVV